MQICLFALLLCAHFVWLLCCFVHILIAYFVVKIIKHCFNWFWFYTVNRGIRSRNILLREKDFGGTWIFQNNSLHQVQWSTNRRTRGKSPRTRSLEALKIRKTRQQKIQDRKDIEDIKDMKNSRGGTGKKRKQLELLGFIGTDKMARVDEDVNNRLFRREIRILTLLL